MKDLYICKYISGTFSVTMWSRYTDKDHVSCIADEDKIAKTYTTKRYENMNEILSDQIDKQIIDNCESNPNCSSWQYTIPTFSTSNVGQLRTSEAKPLRCGDFDDQNGQRRLLGSRRVDTKQPDMPVPPPSRTPMPNPTGWQRYTDKDDFSCIPDNASDKIESLIVPRYENMNEIFVEPNFVKFISKCENDPTCMSWEYAIATDPKKDISNGTIGTLRFSHVSPQKCGPYNTYGGMRRLIGSHRISES